MQAKTRLDSVPYVFAILDEYEDCTIHTAVIYSYMLRKYHWFKEQNQGYFESKTQIADSARVTYASTKQAIAYLKKKGLIEVSKLKGSLHFRNQYVVHDRYGVNKKIFDNPSTLPSQVALKPATGLPSRKLFIKELEEEEDQSPF